MVPRRRIELDDATVPFVGTPRDERSERRTAAAALAALPFLGGVTGILNLLLGDVVRPGTPEWLYGATMVLCVVTAAHLFLRGRISRRGTLTLVLAGNLTYLVMALCVADPVRYATPLLLMFPSFAAAWFLPRRALLLCMAATTLTCFVGLQHSYSEPAQLVTQLGINAALLNLAAAGVYLIRIRVDDLLAATRALSSLDPLTGLPNRRSLVDQAPRVWGQARRDGTRVVALVLDLDHFKQLNDAHGHAAGDAVLTTVAHALRAAVRPADVLARTGGEELVVVGMVSDFREAERLAERLRTAVATTRSPDGHAVTTSVGVAQTRPVDGEDTTDALWRLVDRADAAMYEAKRLGRDRVVASPPLPVPR
jgi:diguanylate cyclase (GGDEF)-like protein